jgi:hypothetical protein
MTHLNVSLVSWNFGQLLVVKIKVTSLFDKHRKLLCNSVLGLSGRIPGEHSSCHGGKFYGKRQVLA